MDPPKGLVVAVSKPAKPPDLGVGSGCARSDARCCHEVNARTSEVEVVAGATADGSRGRPK